MGRWVVVTAGKGTLEVFDRSEGTRSKRSEMPSAVTPVRVSNEGVIIATQMAHPQPGLYLIERGAEPVHLCENVEARLSADLTQLVEIDGWRLTWSRVEGRETQVVKKSVPLLDRVKHGRPHFVGDGQVIVRTDTHLLAGLDLTKLVPEPAEVA